MSMIENAGRVNFQNSVANQVSGGDQYNTTNIYVTEEKTLTLLKPANRRKCDVPRCMERTREAIFKEICLWLNGMPFSSRNDDSRTDHLSATGTDSETIPNIMWISGSPGAGKSAIVSSLISILIKQRRLGSFFFFKRGDVDLSDPTALWRTVAYDLAQSYPCVKASVIKFLSQPGFRESDIQLHFECIIENVLKEHIDRLSDAPPVIVLDALDECGLDDSRTAQRRNLLDTLIRWASFPRSYKLIFTSRDERIPIQLRDRQVCHKITLETGDGVSSETVKDMRVFFMQSLDHIREERSWPSSWPGKAAIELLTRRAAGLFIWAKTAVSFMGERWGDPGVKLKLVLDGDLGQKGENIDRLYQQILDFAFHNADDSTLKMFRLAVGSIIVSKFPLNRHDLKYFVGRPNDVDEWRLNEILHCLSSVLEAEDSLRLRHLSFAEFMTDQKRCIDFRFIINPGDHERNMALACLRIMNADLRFNICGLESSHLRNDEVVDLDVKILRSISSRLSYSCRFWAAHLCGATMNETHSSEMLQELQEFLHARLLYWLEVMSLIKRTSWSLTSLLIAARWIEPFNAKLSEFARDASRFVANFRIPIFESVPHIYLSALPFSPRCSPVSEHFLAQFPGTLSVVEGRDDHWPALLNVLSGHTGSVLSVSYSPDGKRVASGSDDGMLCVWDIETGQLVGGRFGHRKLDHQDPSSNDFVTHVGMTKVNPSLMVMDSLLRDYEGEDGAIDEVGEGKSEVLSVAFSPGGDRIASCSGRQICLWDVETGQLAAGPLIGHDGAVCSIAYSPYGLVASASLDCTVCVWDAEKGGRFSGPVTVGSCPASLLSFAPDGKQLILGLRNDSLYTLDVNTGCICAKRPASDSTTSPLACSPDGKYVVSSSFAGMMHIWDMEAERVVVGPFGIPVHAASLSSVAYSRDGAQIVSGSRNHAVYVWGARTGQMVAGPFKGHFGTISSVAFSPDGTRVVSASEDRTVHVWDVRSAPVTADSITCDGSWLQPLGLSPDESQVVSTLDFRTLCVWDVQTGTTSTGPLRGHGGEVLSVSFSPDGRRIVSGSKDRTICLWDIAKSRTIMDPFVGHYAAVSCVAFSPNGAQIVSASGDSTVRLWDVRTGRTITVISNPSSSAFCCAAFSPDGKRVVSGSQDKTVCVWDVYTSQLVVGPLRGHTGPVKSLAFSPDGKQVASGSTDCTVRVWDLESGQMAARPFSGHEGVIASVAYSPDGKTIISGSHDKTVRAWDTSTGQVAAGPWTNHISEVRLVAFSRDGERVISASHNEILVWPSDSGDKLFTSHQSHLCVLRSIGGPSVFSSCRRSTSDGWIHTPSLPSHPIHPSKCFWVPLHHRQGLCDNITCFPLYSPRTRLDLSRFVHGSSWTSCRSGPC